jgi:hypothetical protein
MAATNRTYLNRPNPLPIISICTSTRRYLSNRQIKRDAEKVPRGGSYRRDSIPEHFARTSAMRSRRCAKLFCFFANSIVYTSTVFVSSSKAGCLLPWADSKFQIPTSRLRPDLTELETTLKIEPRRPRRPRRKYLNELTYLFFAVFAVLAVQNTNPNQRHLSIEPDKENSRFQIPNSRLGFGIILYRNGRRGCGLHSR